MEHNSNSIIDHFLLLGINNESQLQANYYNIINNITVLATITSNSAENINEDKIINIIFPKNDSLFIVDLFLHIVVIIIEVTTVSLMYLLKNCKMLSFRKHFAFYHNILYLVFSTTLHKVSKKVFIWRI